MLLFELKDVLALERIELYDPHRFLGLHVMGEEKEAIRLIRLWRPGASHLSIEVLGEKHELVPVHPSGLFIFTTKRLIGPLDYRVLDSSGKWFHDPYAFLPTLGELDLYLFSQGRHYELARVMGARKRVHQGVEGVSFALWAPGARAVSLVSDSNRWDGRSHPMRSLGASGVWEIFMPSLQVGERYKFEIQTQDKKRLIKADPYALYGELRPQTASIVESFDSFPWTDQKWIKERARSADAHGYLPMRHSRPMLIYELHVGSWKRKADGTPLNYRELAHELVRYFREMNYTHVELMPVMEHPFDASWGYQVTGYFAVSSRWGSVSDFQYLVNYLHMHDIGVIVDWVPAHFPSDEHALARFDGTAIYEHEDPKQGYHPHWHTLIFNYGRHEVSNYLLASALYWCQMMHVDGIRVDAVASMIYLDYGREPGEWIPNRYGGKENLEALEFLRHLNSILHQQCPGVLTFAEESTSFLGVTHRLDRGGLGFDFKWNMGWMNDSLRYMELDPIWRRYHHDEITFAMVYAYSERFVLVLSHDEVVHGKRSLIEKMPGDEWQKYANARLFYSFMICMPGKKLLFMGQDIGQRREWNHDSSVEWDLLQWDIHKKFHRCIRDLNGFYRHHSELWHDDLTHEGFAWAHLEDRDNSTLAYFRYSPHGRLLCVHNFTPSTFERYHLRLPGVKTLKEVFNTDSSAYGGSGKVHDLDIYDQGDGHFTIQLSPLSTLIFEAHG